jgi:hypothetical protein
VESVESIPSPSTSSSDDFFVVALGSDDHVYKARLRGSFIFGVNDWEDLGGPLNSAPILTSFVSGKANVFGLGLNMQMYVAEWDAHRYIWTEDGKDSWISAGGSFLPYLI